MERERRKEKRNERDEREKNLKKCDVMQRKEPGSQWKPFIIRTE